MKKNTLHQIEQLWEQSIEQAHANTPQPEPLNDETLSTVAGLNVKSGVSAGHWTGNLSQKCSNPCPVTAAAC